MSSKQAAVIPILMLAAGKSARFGTDKRVQAVDGQTMLARSISNYQAAGCQVFVVVETSDQIESLLQGIEAVTVLRSSRARLGMGYTLADAVEGLGAFDKLLVGLADKPFVKPATIALVKAALSKYQVVVPTYNGQWGHPVGFDASWRERLLSLRDDYGARALLERSRSQLHFLAVEDPGILIDIDTLDDLEQYRAESITEKK